MIMVLTSQKILTQAKYSNTLTFCKKKKNSEMLQISRNSFYGYNLKRMYYKVRRVLRYVVNLLFIGRLSNGKENENENVI